MNTTSFSNMFAISRRTAVKRLAWTVASAMLPSSAFAGGHAGPRRWLTDIHDRNIRDYLYKMKHFDRPFPEDIFLNSDQSHLLRGLVNRLNRVQKTVGHGNFALLGFDHMLKLARNYASIGEFTTEELDFMEQIFYEDVSRYGFGGPKALFGLTDCIDTEQTKKIPYTGNYLFKGTPMEMYAKVKKDIGDRLVLTSGIRGIPKQFYLFLNKAVGNKGNLSLASRSLAPPGYSFHGVGDFDVGQNDFGALNFTARFTDSEVYHKLTDLGYIRLRYTASNRLGVRFEPWHIKVHGDTANA